MNLHVPQSENAKAELAQLCMVPHNFIAPKNSNPVIGLVQGSMLAAHLVSKPREFLGRSEMMTIMMVFKRREIPKMPEPAILKPVKLWTARQLVSMVFPDDLNVEPKKLNFDDLSKANSQLVIRNGEMLCGTFGKKHLGPRSGSLLHIIRNDHGDDVAKQFLNELKFLLTDWLLYRGFSVGIGDAFITNTSTPKNDSLLPKRNIKRSIQAFERKKREEAEKIEREIVSVIDDVETQVKTYLQTKGKTVEESTKEKAVNTILNKAVGLVGQRIKEYINEDNNLKIMVDGGSKGSDLNISQIIGTLGQQNVGGNRIGYGFFMRTLPHFDFKDERPASRGFVASSYKKGLKPEEYFFHAMGGREGLVDTAIKTGKVGYISRKLMKALEDHGVKYDGTVRDSLGDVLQYLYGEDGLDPTKLEFQSIDSVLMNNTKFNDCYKFDEESIEKYTEVFESSRNILESEYQRLQKDRRFIQKLHSKLEGIYRCSGFGHIYLPVSLDRVILNARRRFRTDKKDHKNIIHPNIVIQKVDELFIELEDIRGDFIMKMQPYCMKMIFIAIRSKLASKRVIHEYKFSSVILDWVCNKIRIAFKRAIVHPGEMVGAIAAESIAEPTQQMTLNSKYFIFIL